MFKQQDNEVIVDSTPKRRQPLANISANSNIKNKCGKKSELKFRHAIVIAKEKELQYY